MATTHRCEGCDFELPGDWPATVVPDGPVAGYGGYAMLCAPCARQADPTTAEVIERKGAMTK